VTFDRITMDPDLMGGVPTIRGLRIPVATVVSMVADGMTVDEICADLPDLSPADVTEALRYAAETVRERRLPLRPSARDCCSSARTPTSRRCWHDLHERLGFRCSGPSFGTYSARPRIRHGRVCGGAKAHRDVTAPRSMGGLARRYPHLHHGWAAGGLIAAVLIAAKTWDGQ
jgi:uncharacterized protein (DUF433 family)